jgi:hypothetical protein
LHFARKSFDGFLAILGSVANVIGSRSDDGREAVAKLRDDFLRVVEGKRRLREKCEAIGIRDHELVHFFDAADHDGLIGRFSGSADDFLVIAVAY